MGVGSVLFENSPFYAPANKVEGGGVYWLEVCHGLWTQLTVCMGVGSVLFENSPIYAPANKVEGGWVYWLEVCHGLWTQFVSGA